MNITKEFEKLVTKFLFFNCNDHQNNKNKLNELNILLNDINSLNYEKNNISDSKAAINLLDNFTNLGFSEEILIVKSCYTIKILVNKQKIKIPVKQYDKLITWLCKCVEINSGISSNCLTAMQTMFKHHSEICGNYSYLISSHGLLSKLLDILLENHTTDSSLKVEKYDGNSKEEILSATLHCIEALLISLNLNENENLLTDLSAIGNKVLSLLYCSKANLENWNNKLLSITSALNILNKIVNENQEWCEKNVAELLGVARNFLLHGVTGVLEFQCPQKVLPSQQSVIEEIPTTNLNKGGKIQKLRKPRTINKNKPDTKNLKKQNKNQSGDSNKDPVLTNAEKLNVDYDHSTCVMNLNKTSDSDYSDPEGNRAQNENHKQTKLRISAISLVGVIAKNVNKKMFYGYWHSLFPSNESNSTVNLFNVIIKDPSPKCRIIALQVTSVMLYGSKGYLLQAENIEKPPAAFMPFSVSLGNMILSIYEILTKALSNESSIPVLTQILKCLAVLIQVTPFTRLKMGFVAGFIRYIRRLIYHKDPTIQVAALMVVEFIISTQDITTEITECIEIPQDMSIASNTNAILKDSGVEEFIGDESFDEIEIDSDNIDIEFELTESLSTIQTATPCIQSTVKMSWVLQRVLENLGVLSGVFKIKNKIATNPVRIESLQVLTSMATHFLFIKDHLELITAALNISLNDNLQDIRLYSGKCLDAIGHAINIYLIENCKLEIINTCQYFWVNILPSVIVKIQDASQSLALKCILCDYLSTIGSHIFEKLPDNTQIQLISLLSGISCNFEEESLVRASAVRALAIYAMFPSLKEDLCYVENTAESIFHLIKDKNNVVRIKSSWALGNISDALISNCQETDLDRISDDLLKRLLEVSNDLIADNDKVRCNTVRTIGNLLTLITRKHLDIKSWRSLAMVSIEKIIHSINTGSNAKVKWNSCYALGNLMKNLNFYTAYSDLEWQNLVFSTLCNLIVTNGNFKVRINGAAALIVIKDRKLYGQHFKLIWSSLLLAMEQSDNLIDFNEYKHRDNLQEQLCISLGHFIQISMNSDFIVLENELTNYEIIKENWLRVINRVSPDNCSTLINSSIFLKQLLDNSDRSCPKLTVEQKKSIETLANCFVSPIEELFL